MGQAQPLFKITLKEVYLFGFFLLLDVGWKFLMLIFLLDGCHGAGGNPNRRICAESQVPFWMGLSVPLFVDALLIGLLLVFLATPLAKRLNPIIRSAIYVLLAFIILLSGALIWRLPLFSARL